ncbi:MAG: hypothetical protein NTX75_08915 [Proteobacteria bacterium]|nr:hypothetical protein [Pseudomonadota bacterium]
MRNPSNPKLLLIVKQFCEEANHLSLLGDDFSSMKAVLYMDFAVEQMLNVITLDYSSSSEIDSKMGRDNVNWNILWQNAVTSIKNEETIDLKNIPYFKDLKSLHEIRNLVQHRGHIPSANDVSRYLASAKRMVSECFEKCYGFNVNDFRLINTIRNPHLRCILEDSEKALSLCVPVISLAGSIIAFRKVVAAIHDMHEGFTPDFNHVEKIIAARVSSFKSRINNQPTVAELSHLLGGVASALNREIQSLRVDLEVANLGLSMADTTRFRRMIDSLGVHEGDDDSLEIVVLDETLNYAEYAKFALNYLSSLILLSQEVYPEAIDNITVLLPLHKQSIWKERVQDSQCHERSSRDSRANYVKESDPMSEREHR